MEGMKVSCLIENPQGIDFFFFNEGCTCFVISALNTKWTEIQDIKAD
jgi:hypothetical protein